MLQVNQLSIHYGSTPVVCDFNVSLGEDEILMLVGPTGCGKTTILKSLAGLVPIHTGEIRHGKWCVTAKHDLPPEKRNVGMVFQDFALFPHLTVEENIGFRLKTSNRVNHWIALLGLETIRDAKPDRLSGGQKQRVALARTLAHEPAFVLLDEPLSNLDAALKDDLRWEIRQALKAAKVPAIWVTHDQEEALSVGDRVGILNHGQLVQLDTPSQCYNHPVNAFVAGFLGDANFLSGEYNCANQVTTALGSLSCIENKRATSAVDVLLRPEDAKISKDSPSNGKIEWIRYEGRSQLCLVRLENSELIKVRCPQHQCWVQGESVQVAITTNRNLVVF